MVFKSRLLQNLVLAQKSLAALSLIPLLLILWNLHSKKEEIRTISQRTAKLEQMAKRAATEKKREELAWKQIEEAYAKKPNYIGQVIESLPLLAAELRRTQAFVKHHPDNKIVQERLSFLQSDQNKIRFIQQVSRPGPFFQESELKLHHPVQMDEDDLRKFLVAVEGDDYSAKQLLIKDFELTKRKEGVDEMVYNIEVELIRRSP